MTVLRPQAGNRGLPTMQDVADHAGVSIATVSNVLNHPDKVTEATAQRVRLSIDELGFVRNDAGRSLATGSSSSIGMVVADLDNSLFTDMAQGAQVAARSARLSVLLGNAACEIRQQNDYLDLFDEARVRGVLLAPMEDSSDGIRRMRAHGRQIVLLNYAPESNDCCAVVVDNQRIGYLAAQHLIDIGRTRLAFLATHEDYQPVHDRRLGIRKAVAEAGGRVQLEEVTTEGLQYDAGREAARKLLNRPEASRPDGVIGVTDALALGFIEEAAERQLAVIPVDVAVVGCEDNRGAVTGPIALTTVAHPGREMGSEAMGLLVEELSDEQDTHRHRTITLQPELVVRETTVPRRAPTGR